MLLDVVQLRGLSAVIAACICAAFIGGIVYKRQTRGSAFVYSVDFTGGTQAKVRFTKPQSNEPQPTSGQQVKDVLEQEFPGLVTRELADHEMLIRVKKDYSDEQGETGRIRSLLENNLSNTEVTIAQSDSVGADIGESLRTRAIWAVAIILVLMLGYIGSRFWGISYAAASVVSLMHDVLVILTFVVWFDYEISMHIISAILFILGYSINDTIVIFARIRENIYKYKQKTLGEIVNTSVNQTLRRTILTSVATCLVVVALLIFGGEALRTLSIALLIGMIFGTYSSIFVASPVMMALHRS